MCWLAKAPQCGHFTGKHPKSSAWGQHGAFLLLGFSCLQSCCAAGKETQEPLGLLCNAGVHICTGSSCTPPFSSLCPIPESCPCRVPPATVLLGFLQSAALGNSLISQGSWRFPFLYNVHSLVESTWVITGFPAVPS